LEREFWDGVKEISDAQKITLHELVTFINRDRPAKMNSAMMALPTAVVSGQDA
jgi:predicted DNA-binding ribbon-helix-helix protein